MNFTYSPTVEEFRAEVRALIAEHVTAEERERAHHTGTNICRPLYRALGERGILARVTPGVGTGDPVEFFAFTNEMEVASVPFDAITMVVAIAGVVARVGTEEQKARILPGLLSGDELVCFGLTEPDGGSDLAATATRAALDGDTWVVNGAKMWTTMAHEARWVFLIARSDPTMTRYGGFTAFLVPMDSPGITVDPVLTMSTERSNATFYDDVRVSPDNVLGEPHEGWRTLGVMLSFERGMGNTSFGTPLLRRFAAWAAGSGRIDDVLVRERMAQIAIDNEVSRLLTQRTVWLAASGALPGTEGSIAKVHATEAYQRASRWLQAAAGPAGLLGLGEPGAAAEGWIDHDVRHSVPQTLQGGTSEINRNNIAERHLGLPRWR